MRIKFEKGEQKKFIKEVMKNIGAPNLKELINRGIDVNYSSLKNYFSERRCLPRELFLSLCGMANLDWQKFNVKDIDENWGQSKGGKKSKRNGPAQN